MKKDPGKVLMGVDMVQLQDHVDTLKNLKVVRLLKWEYTAALVFITDILDNAAISEEDLGGKTRTLYYRCPRCGDHYSVGRSSCHICDYED